MLGFFINIDELYSVDVFRIQNFENEYTFFALKYLIG